VGAWVRLESFPAPVVLLQRAETNALGQFTFERLAENRQYRLRAGARGYPIQQRDLTVPSETGEYDFLF
jgi:hypothetical protein